MKSKMKLNVPAEFWRPIEDMPNDGRLCFIKDANGNEDIACWDRREWSAEFGDCDEPTHYHLISIG